MKKFAQLIGRLPFAGKMAIRPLIFALYSSTKKVERRNSYLLLMSLLIMYILLHGVQMKMGIRALEFESPTWAKVISALYAITNFCVVLTQIQLCYRATRFFMRGLYPRVKRSYVENSRLEIAIMLAVTLGGQIIFLYIFRQG